MKREVQVSNPQRICPECGDEFTATHGRQVFCCTEHQDRFHTTMKVRGKVAMPFVMTWRMGKRGRTDATSYAMSELCALADQWAAEDKACGRRPDLIVSAKMREGWRAPDIEGRSRANCFTAAPTARKAPHVAEPG